MARCTDARDRFQAQLDGLAVPDWTRRSQLGGWSIGEIAGHVQLSEAGSFRAMFRALRDARKAGLGPETSDESVEASMDQYAIADSPEPRVAPSFTVPGAIVDREEVLRKLAANTSSLHQWAAEADGLALSAVLFPHPAFGQINLYQWVIFLGQHTARHARQVSAILAEPIA
jgi:hypothetical protein